VATIRQHRQNQSGACQNPDLAKGGRNREYVMFRFIGISSSHLTPN
jgi:hypothetical protein